MRLYGSTMLPTRARKFNMLSESNGLVTQPEGTSLDLLLLLWKARIPFEVPGQMTYLVASLTLDSARPYVMQGAPFTQGTISSIPIVGSISPEGFLPPILLLVVIIVMVVIVAVILVVVVVVIVGVVIVAIIRDKASSVKVPVANVTLFSSAHLLRENTDLVCSNQQMRPTSPSVPLK
ncbi:hypothetical protein Tco_0169020 [Tanacetum coccineum]